MTRYFTSGSIAHEIGCATETVRLYERRGIVRPVRDSQGRRLFTTEDLEVLRKYRRTRDTQHKGLRVHS